MIDNGHGTADLSATRFGESPAQEHRNRGEVIASGAALVALVLGVPLVLLLMAGAPPVPSSVPDRDALTQPITSSMLVSVLVAVVWLVWLLFVVCVALEIMAALRGGMARPVPLGGPVQRLARTLVGALLLAGVTIGPAASAAPVSGSPVSSTSVSTVEATPELGDTAAPDDEADDEATKGSLVGKKVYVVQAPKGGYHDNLWDIAERHLGDGRRYKEIYELNHHRTQADGSTLHLARLIQPGWELVMPEDATGVPRVHAQEHAPGGAGQRGSQQSTGEVTPDPEAPTVEVDSSNEIAGLVGGGLLAAGIVGSLIALRRRRIGRDPAASAAQAEVWFRVSATPARADALDCTLRQLATRCLNENIPLPSIYAVVLDDTHVELMLAPARTDTCSGWEALDDGRSWRGEVDRSPAPHVVAPYPALVSLGVDASGRDVLVDLEAAGGVVSLVGAGQLVSEVAAAIAVQAATSAWSDAVEVTASHLSPALAEVGDERIRLVDDLTTILPELEEGIGRLRDGVLTGRLSRRGWVPSHLLVAAGAQEAGVIERLAALTGASRQAFAVVVAGESPAARWHLRVDDSGVLTVPALGLSVVANRISAAELDAVAELFAAGRETPRDDGSRPLVPQTQRPSDDADWAAGSRRVGVVGPIAVEGLGGLDDVRRAEATEVVAFLALHPTPVHPHVLAGAIWPRGVTDDVRDAALERVMLAFGTDPEGRNHLRRDPEGRYTLGPDVVCDWDSLRTMLARSRQAASPRHERDLLDRALTMVRGEPFAGRPPGRYAWLAATGVERAMRALVVDAAHRLAMLRLDDDDPSGARVAVGDGLRLEPTSLLLWRDMLRSAHRLDAVAGVRRVVDEMSATLEQFAVPLDPETEALIDELLPGLRSLRASG